VEEHHVHDSLKSNVTWTSLGWLVPLAFLALPDCGFPGHPPDPNLDRGTAPHTALVYCDLQDRSVDSRCVGPTEPGIPLQSAALNLVRNNKNLVALDYRPEAAAEAGLECPTESPVVAITFQNVFPDGSPVCLSANQVVGTYGGHPDKICEAWCFDQFGEFDEDNEASDEIKAFCSEKARVSTNADPLNFLFLAACTDGGAPRPDFQDPRRRPEPVHWRDRIGVAVSGSGGNTLTRTAADTGGFDAGAASVQLITRGDAYVEFTLAEATTARACGLSPAGEVDPETGQAGPDLDPTLAAIGFAVRAVGNNLMIHENSGPAAGIPAGTYLPGDRIRVAVTDILDGTGRITYSQILGSCTLGPLCTGTPLGGSTVAAPYPFRVDSSFRTPGASLTDVVLVRIK
jgi:hypothetical protein